MSTVTVLKIPPRMPDDMPGLLRELADHIESGRITAMVVGFCRDDCYEFLWPSSIVDSFLISSMLQASALDKLREAE